MPGLLQLPGLDVLQRFAGALRLGSAGLGGEVLEMVGGLGAVVGLSSAERELEVELTGAQLRLGGTGEHLFDLVLGVVELPALEEAQDRLHPPPVLGVLDQLDGVADVVRGLDRRPVR